MNWAQSQVDQAEACCVAIVAEGTSESTIAAIIIIKPTESFDFMTLSFIAGKAESLS